MTAEKRIEVATEIVNTMIGTGKIDIAGESTSEGYILTFKSENSGGYVRIQTLISSIAKDLKHVVSH